MLPMYEHIHFFYLALSIIFEVIANILIKLSNGFEKKLYALSAMACVFGAFTALSFAIEGIRLSVAYAIWGGIGLASTALLGISLFKECLRPTGWIGIAFLILGVGLIRVA